MNLEAIQTAFRARIHRKNHITFINGEPNMVHIGGTARNVHEIQLAIAAVQEVAPDAHIDLKGAFNSLVIKTEH